MQGKSGCFALQNSRFWKTKEKALIFCKDISEVVGRRNGAFGIYLWRGEADAQKK
ncbi:hypothetical protein PI172_2083 [Prevotella intermedia]|uniref:Uncharacterized protein n=1 Tax=Prevotella intermedia TaxID=28131 RepID=A0AAD1BKE5_PREIN|nr:hypothetical protein PI172_2083 [Prevotella intermedia]